LKKDKVEGVLIDLRNNGGGSLDEAIALTCLFTGSGPVLQERNSEGKVKVDSCKDTKRIWDGPLSVLINRSSASASEIFVAAIQDYGRGLVIGEPSFGKGTVQTIINFDKKAPDGKPKFGELKMTIAQFFRINGGTTQLRGVTPDIGLPSISDTESFGESSYDNALPWTQITAANYTQAGDITRMLPQLQSRHVVRIAKDKEFQYLLEDIADFKLQRQKRVISLNEAERRKERDAQEARLKLRVSSSEAEASKIGSKIAKDQAAALKKALLYELDTGSDERNLSDELAAEKAQKEARDIWLDEAANILGDQIELLKTDAKLTARVAPAPAQAAARKPE
jgi:carboxyl-terminal processing protease